MTPAYLNELADLADPDKLWQLGAFEQLALPPEKRKQLDAGVALRRHASHVARIEDLIGKDKSLILTPLSPGGTAVATVTIHPEHKKLLEEKERRTLGRGSDLPDESFDQPRF